MTLASELRDRFGVEPVLRVLKIAPPTATPLSRKTCGSTCVTKTGGRFLEEETEGTLAGRPYYRMGILGFSTIDRRYEWTTFDSVTPTAMTYRGAPVSGRPSVLSIRANSPTRACWARSTSARLSRCGPSSRSEATTPPSSSTSRRTASPSGWSTGSSAPAAFADPPGQKERLVNRLGYSRKIR
ncbi:DUF1579 domain-containing protein [Micromonospora sp. MP36]|nr:DUF1579 domain-containing protein [Micromonospora sp. MP36]